ncbi:MAG TPA: TonB-dependent receptor, partial [Candidatus Kapabacteria bacterium]|nr:TonB-dependent receptor [Candidatus Kapabacteria bacterium]
MCPFAANAGSIHGVVKSENKPLTGATVRILELDRADHTDAKGEFTFRDVPNGTYRVFVRMLGYATTTNTVKILDNTVETTFSLKESAIENEDVVITASPYARPVDEQYQSSESKAQVELHQSPGASFAEEISDMPGVDVRWNGSAPARPMLRGLSDNEVLVLENGLRTGDISTFDPAHSVPIEPLGVSQIDIVRGPASIMYGPNAIGGLVNVITNTIPTVSSTPFFGTASVGLNSVNDGYSGYFNGVYSNGGSAFGVSAGGTHTQDIRIPEANYFDGIDNFNFSRIPQSWDHSWEGGFGYSYQGDLGMIGIGYKYYGMTYGIPGTPPNADWANDPPATSLIEQEKNSVELRALFPVNGAFIKQIKFNGSYAGYWHSEYPTAQDSTGVSDPQANHFNLNGINASLQLQHEESSSLHGTFGVWLSNQNLTIEGDQPLGPNSTTIDAAGYLFEEYQAGENTRLQAAARFDYNHIQTSPYAASTDPVFQTLDTALTSSAVTASIGALQKLGDDMTLSLNIGRSFRAPTVQELFANGLDAASSSYSIGDANLVPETGLGIDLSLKGTFDIVSIELSPYVNFINNYIYSYFTGAD